MFVLACDVLEHYKRNKKVKMPFILKDVEKALLN